MTLLLALKAADGLVFAGDSQGTFGDASHTNKIKKIFLLAPKTALLMAGTSEVGTMLIYMIQKELAKQGADGVSRVMELVRQIARDQYNQWYPNVPAIKPLVLTQGSVSLRPELNFLIGGYELDDTPRIFGLGSSFDFSPMMHDYGFAVQGITQYAFYLLSQLFDSEHNLSDMVNLAVHIITETARQDDRVGGTISVIAIKPGPVGGQFIPPDRVIQIQENNRLRAEAMRKTFFHWTR